jgi:putative flippase GtrA
VRIVRFIVAGGIGFLVDAVILSALTSMVGWHPLRARIVSFLCAVTVTWWLNRRYTFADRRGAQQRTTREYSRYLLVQGAGAALNYAVFAAAILLVPALKPYPVLPLVLGSGVAMCCNYFAMQRWVFPEHAARV